MSISTTRVWRGNKEKKTALGMPFFSYLCITLTMRVWRGNKEENRPKRRIWRRLGPRYVFFLFLCIFFQTNQHFLSYFGSTDVLKRQGSWQAVSTLTTRVWRGNKEEN